MLDSDPPSYTEVSLEVIYTEPEYHPDFRDIATFQVKNTRFRVHEHFLFTNSSVFRRIFRLHPSRSSSDHERLTDENCVIHLDGVSVLEFESLLTFFYEGWQGSFSMPMANWIALLAITHRFKFAEAELRARREVFEGSVLRPVDQIVLAEKHGVPMSFIVPALEDLVRRSEFLNEEEIVHLSGEMVARLNIAREKYVRESSRMFASETWLKRAAHDIVMSVWCVKETASI